VAAKYHCPPFFFAGSCFCITDGCVGGANFGTGNDNNNARAKAFI
jgi:hypothetical protein